MRSSLPSKDSSAGLIHSAGFTLIEAIIYIALLSCLLGTFIPYAYAIHAQDLQLLDQIIAAEAA